jgi:DNA-directed RNA polymerase subunit RPC12/RpoP
MTVECRQCKKEMIRVLAEQLGEIFECPYCGSSVAFDWDKDTVQVDRRWGEPEKPQ